MNARQRGVALFVTLALLTALMLLAVAGNRLTLQAERMARNDRDRIVARIAAEAALREAAEATEGGPVRDWLTSAVPCGTGRVVPAGAYCGVGEPDAGDAADSAPLGAALQTGAGSLPARPPRYVIAAGPGSGFRLYAIGYGARSTTQVRLTRVCSGLPRPAC